MNLDEKIANLTEDDYSNTFDISRILDYINSRGKEALQKWNLTELRYLNGVIHTWLNSINKWKERYRRLLIKISRVEQDLQSLSLRMTRMIGEGERQVLHHKRSLIEKQSAPIEKQELPKTYELPPISEG